MSNLAAQIAAEHWLTAHEYTHCVGCGWVPDRRFEDVMVAARRHVAEVALAEVDRLQAEIAENRETIRTLMDSYREAIGVPPSEHQSRRLEQMAQRLEEALAERPTDA